MIKGPEIVILYPKDGETVSSTTQKIYGVSKRAQKIYIQGRLIPNDLNGNFETIIVTHSPYTKIEAVAEDKYNKKNSHVIFVVPK
jgi:hypothetical protein